MRLPFSKFWLVVAATILLLAAAGLSIVMEDSQRSRMEVESNSAHQLQLLAYEIGNDLHAGAVENLNEAFKRWVTSHAKVEAVRLQDENGRVVAEYRRKQRAEQSHVVQMAVEFAGTRQARLGLVRDSSRVFEMRSRLIWQVASAWVLTSGLLIGLTRMLLLYRAESARRAARSAELAAVNAALQHEAGLRRAATLALEERENRLRTFIASSPVALAMFDRNMCYLQASQRWLTDFGLGERELSGLSHYEVFPEISDAWKEIHRRGLAGEVIRAEEDRFERADGTVQWLRWEVRPWRDASDAVGGLMIFSEDISARKQTENDLRRSELKFRKMIDASPVPCALNDDWQNIIYLNAAFTRTFGYESRDIPTLADWWPKAYPDMNYRQWVAEAWQGRLAKAQREVAPFEPLEVKIRTKHGAERTVVADATSLTESFAGVHLVTLFDITERKSVEETLLSKTAFLEALINSSLNGILVVGPDGRKIFQNQRTVELWKIPPEITNDPDDHVQLRFVVGRTKNPEAFVEKVTSLYAHPDATSLDEVELNDGTFLERQSAPVMGANGKNFGRIWIFHDITARKRAQVERQTLEGQLRQSQKLEAIGTLAGGIAHDFNNILAGIYGFTSLARDSAGGNPALHNYLDEIGRAGRRAAELVQRILAFSRSRNGDETMEPVHLGLVAAEAVKLLRAGSPSTIELVAQVTGTLPAVMGNATQLHQVVMNLGTNAVQAMRDRPGRLSISLDACVIDEALARALPGLQPGPGVRLTVGDTGDGMNAATQERVFEPFFTTKGPGEGTGLGLSVVHGIVRSHHGAIRLSSEVGRGSTFEVFLPAANSAVPETEAEPAVISRGRGERILVIDDEPMIVTSIHLALTQLGYEVVSENSAQAALARLEREPQVFDLVLSDQTMPGLTGLDLAQHIRTAWPDLPVVLMSGHSTALTAERLREAGVREVMGKPYIIDRLAVVIRRNLSATPRGRR